MRRRRRKRRRRRNYNTYIQLHIHVYYGSLLNLVDWPKMSVLILAIYLYKCIYNTIHVHVYMLLRFLKQYTEAAF